MTPTPPQVGQDGHQARVSRRQGVGLAVETHTMELVNNGPWAGAYTVCGATSCDWHSLWHFGRDRVQDAWDDGLTHGVRA